MKGDFETDVIDGMVLCSPNDRFGRKPTMFLLLLFLAGGTIIEMNAKNWQTWAGAKICTSRALRRAIPKTSLMCLVQWGALVLDLAKLQSIPTYQRWHQLEQEALALGPTNYCEW